MTKEEKAIEKAAKKCPFIQPNNCETIDEQVIGLQCVIWGAKSQAAKEYWQKGMYSEEEVSKLLSDYDLYLDQCKIDDIHPTSVFKWFNQNKNK